LLCFIEGMLVWLVGAPSKLCCCVIVCVQLSFGPLRDHSGVDARAE
jgi:hypothetical protein